MNIEQLVQCWINGNRKDVIDYVLGLDNPAQVAYYTAGIVWEFEAMNTTSLGNTLTFQNMLTSRM